MPVDTRVIVQTLMQQRDRLFAYLWGILGDTQLADDTLQDLYLLAVEKSSEIQDAQHLAGWLRRAARLKALETMRVRGRLPVSLTDDVLDQFEAFWEKRSALADGQVVKSLRECIDRLTSNNRQLLTLRYVEGKKTNAIAGLLERKVEAVYKALVRIHRSLRECIENKLMEATLHD